MKSVLVIGPAHPLRGGIAAFSERLANAFMEKGYKVHIETFSLQYPKFLFPGKTQLSSSPAPENLNITVSINSINPFNWIKVGKKLKKKSYDLVLIPYWLPFMAPCLGTIAGIIRKNRKSKIIAIAHNYIPHEKRPGDKLFTKYFSRKTDGFVALSKSVLHDIDELFPDIPKVFSPHPIYDHYGMIISKTEARKKLQLELQERHLLFFGIVRDYKGLDLLLEAMAFKEIRDLNIKLIVAGEFYSDPEKYLNYIKENTLEDSIILKQEFIPDEEVGLYFCAADLIVQPYRSATQSGVTQIGFHFEKPMLVTNVGGLSEIIPHNTAGYVVERDPKQIAESIVDYYKNDRENQFIEGVLDEKKKYDWNKMVEAVLALL